MTREVYYKGLKLSFDSILCEDPNTRNETMIEQALQWVKNLTVDSSRCEFKRRPGDPPHIIFRDNGDGSLDQTEVEPGYRALKVNRIADLVHLATSHFDHKVKEAKRIVIAYGPDCIELIFDHTTGRERARLALNATRELQFFNSRVMESLIEPSDLYKALRYDLSETFLDRNLPEKVSTVSFAQNNETNQASARGNESMGSMVEKAVKEPQTLPSEHQIFKVRSYLNPELTKRVDLKCLLDPDPNTRCWILYPDFQSWVDLQNKALEHIGGLLRDLVGERPDVRIYEGTFKQESPDFTRAV